MSASNLINIMKNHLHKITHLAKLSFPTKGQFPFFQNRPLTFPFSHIYSGSKKEKWLDVEHDCIYWVEQQGVIEMLENHRQFITISPESKPTKLYTFYISDSVVLSWRVTAQKMGHKSVLRGTTENISKTISRWNLQNPGNICNLNCICHFFNIVYFHYNLYQYNYLLNIFEFVLNI